jgi:hypothetical protein
VPARPRFPEPPLRSRLTSPRGRRGRSPLQVRRAGGWDLPIFRRQRRGTPHPPARYHLPPPPAPRTIRLLPHNPPSGGEAPTTSPTFRSVLKSHAGVSGGAAHRQIDAGWAGGRDLPIAPSPTPKACSTFHCRWTYRRLPLGAIRVLPSCTHLPPGIMPPPPPPAPHTIRLLRFDPSHGIMPPPATDSAHPTTEEPHPDRQASRLLR